MHVERGGARLELVEGNVADQDTDAVVTAAHGDLGGGQGTDGVIHVRAGPALAAACRAIGFCDVGDAVLTPGFELPARFVIHAVGPVWNRDKRYQVAQLASAYQESLRLCREHGLRTVSFPSISTGAFAWPLKVAAPIALGAIVAVLDEHPGAYDLVRIVLYPREQPAAYSVYSAALRALRGMSGIVSG